MSSEALFIQDSMDGFDEFGVPNFVKQTKNFMAIMKNIMKNTMKNCKLF